MEGRACREGRAAGRASRGLIKQYFEGAYSTDIQTETATYHGECALGVYGNSGVLGLHLQNLVQDLAPTTAVVAIKPRYLLINRLAEPVQFHAVQVPPQREHAWAPRLSDIFRPHESGSDIFRPHEEQSRALVTHGFFSRADDFEMHHEGGGNPFSLEWADEPRDHRSAFALPDEEQLANLPSAPPNSVVPMYAFPPVTHTRASLHGLLRLLFLRTAVGGGDGGVEEWSPPLQLVDETRAHLFARMRSAGREGVDADLRFLLVSFNQEGPTSFVSLEDATETPQCCIRNDSNRICTTDLDWRRQGAGDQMDRLARAAAVEGVCRRARGHSEAREGVRGGCCAAAVAAGVGRAVGGGRQARRRLRRPRARAARQSVC